MMQKTISIIGVPMACGQSYSGVGQAPKLFRSLGLVQGLKALDYKVIDNGNVSKCISNNNNNERIKNLEQVANLNEELAICVDKIVANKHFPLILGGDHSIAIGSLAGVAKHYKELGVIWFDAHGDLNTDDTSSSGNIHGMPLAASLGYGHPLLVNIHNYQPKIKPENIVIIGLRSLDPGDKALINTLKIKSYTAEDIKTKGIETIINSSISYLQEKTNNIHFSFDLDVIDPSLAPGVGTPVPGGITNDDCITAVKILAKSKFIRSFEVVEVNPEFDNNNKTITIAYELILEFFRNLL